MLAEPNPRDGWLGPAKDLCEYDFHEYFKQALLVFRNVIKKGSIVFRKPDRKEGPIEG